MARKKLRDIVVLGNTWKWYVRPDEDYGYASSPSSICIIFSPKLFERGSRKPVRKRYEIDLGCGEVTPSMVEHEIVKIVTESFSDIIFA